jgi:hypothetical protein
MSRNLFLKSRFAVILILLCLIALMEASRPFPFFRLATFIFSFVALAGVASLFRGKVRDGLVVLASLVFGLCAIEGVATVLQPKTLINGVTKAGRSAGPSSAGDRNMPGATMTKSGIRKRAPSSTLAITQSMPIFFGRPPPARRVQRSSFSAIPLPLAWA